MRDKIKCLGTTTCSVCSDPCVGEELTRAKAERDEAWKCLRHQGALLDKVKAEAAILLEKVKDIYKKAETAVPNVDWAQVAWEMYKKVSSSTAGQDFLAERKAKDEGIERLRNALKFYADEKKYRIACIESDGSTSFAPGGEVLGDKGFVARTTLKDGEVG